MSASYGAWIFWKVRVLGSQQSRLDKKKERIVAGEGIYSIRGESIRNRLLEHLASVSTEMPRIRTTYLVGIISPHQS